MKKYTVLLVGILFIGVSAFLYFRNEHLVKSCTMEAEATVVDMDQELNTDSDTVSNYMYYPIVEYKAGENTVRAKMDSGSSTPEYELGTKITILYNPNKTNEFIVKGEKTMGILSIVFAVIGLGVTVYGIKEAVSPKS